MLQKGIDILCYIRKNELVEVWFSDNGSLYTELGSSEIYILCCMIFVLCDIACILIHVLIAILFFSLPPPNYPMFRVFAPSCSIVLNEYL